MLRIVRGASGQIMVGQIAVLFIFVVAALSIMSTYVRRAYQGKMRDADIAMMNSAAIILNRNVPISYEPYYTDSRDRKNTRYVTSETVRYSIYTRGYNDYAGHNMRSRQAAPAEAQW